VKNIHRMFIIFHLAYPCPQTTFRTKLTMRCAAAAAGHVLGAKRILELNSD
jgi:hypothetical protein